MYRLITIILLMGFLNACNTINGVGKDLEAAGEAVQKSAK